MAVEAERAAQDYVGKLTDSRRWAQFVPRDGDIVVCTPPKSGTTWTQSILAMLIARDPEVDAQTAVKSPWIDRTRLDVSEVMARLAAQDHRRQVKTHTPLDGIPYWPQLRYVTVYRHPIDVYFSYRNHARNQNNIRETGYFPEAYFLDDPAEGFRVFVQGEHNDGASLHSVVAHYRKTLLREPRENLLRLHYADMLRDLPSAVARIAHHGAFDAGPELLDGVVKAARFETMKANAGRYVPSAGTGNWKDDAGFFDSASSDKWLGKVSDIDLAAYETRIAGMLTPPERRWLERGSGG